ncbi:PAAR repeat-containing protein [Burkholderia contaminans]|uniref:PAAR domain-containing protein n=1 Tax=Burkholderia contaminans TaxID=488447 RepID=A0A3N8PY88_9BURK|nr:PAAR domain-containing protein [Burkholderia contaminans]RQT16345.1 PAAR domain-containing protein [Burkholderia contaminans]VWC73233.1 PAAR repeat-containing protein [Burkholderia contaminans]
MQDIVCEGDMTDHGGVVMQGFANSDLNGRKIAGLGHLVSCPKCKGVFPIAEGSPSYDIDGVPVALHNMKTSCGASLIAGGSHGSVG